MNRQYIIGVDGGATKSSALISQIKGKIISKRVGKALNYHSICQF